MNASSVGAWCLAAPLIPVLGTFIVETLCGLPRSGGKGAAGSTNPRSVILMPAHNEEAVIGQTIRKVLAESPDYISLLVVADNCSDTTAAIARQEGAQVIERCDPVHRGKGYALAFGRDHMRGDPPQCVIVLDSDCSPSPGTLSILASEAFTSGRPVQANNQILPRSGAPPLVQISNFAFLVKNLIRQRGAARIGAPALLTGTGMAFPWPVFADAPLASGDIVEDLALGIDLMQRGHKPMFIEEALVTSAAANEGDTITQRTRWEHGFLKTAFSRGLPLAGKGIASLRWPIFWSGMHLLVPPLALLIILSFIVALCLFAAGWLFEAGYGPFYTVAGLLTAAGLGIFGAWLREGRGVLRFGALLRVPLYILWKIPVYLRLVRGGETQWVRTKRTGE